MAGCPIRVNSVSSHAIITEEIRVVHIGRIDTTIDTDVGILFEAMTTTRAALFLSRIHRGNFKGNMIAKISRGAGVEGVHKRLDVDQPVQLGMGKVFLFTHK